MSDTVLNKRMFLTYTKEDKGGLENAGNSIRICARINKRTE